MKSSAARYSLWAMICAMSFVVLFRSTHIEKNELSWDVFGYYLWLPATFIYDDPGMKDRAWVEQVNEKYEASGTLYQLSTNDEGEPIYFFLMGMSIFYAPFFLIGHGIAAITGAPMDGFSAPYQYSMVFGGIFYTLLGLWLFRKLLLQFLNDKITAAVLLVVVFATNYSHHLTSKDLETVNILFLLMCWLLLSTVRWHESQKTSYIVQIGASITLMALVKPSEVLAVFIPLLWGIKNSETLSGKIRLLWQKRKQVIIAVLACLIIALPQIIYWKVRTGHYFYDSYKNPGVGLDFNKPHLLDVLFSYKKGWLLYTPMMAFALAGCYFLIRKRKEIALSLLFYLCISFYLIASWTEWWYGAAFSCRPIITSYPILGITLGLFFEAISSKRVLRYSMLGIAVLATALNQFQWWQLRNYILDPYRTTKAYYQAIFLKTTVPPNAEQLKSFNWDFSAEKIWNDPENYHLKLARRLTDFPDTLSADEFSKDIKIRYGNITRTDHLWIKAAVSLQTPDTTFSYGPFLVMTILHDDKPYGYFTLDLAKLDHSKPMKVNYLTPPIRSEDDILSCYVWNPSHNRLIVRKIELSFFEENQ